MTKSPRAVFAAVRVILVLRTYTVENYNVSSCAKTDIKFCAHFSAHSFLMISAQMLVALALGLVAFASAQSFNDDAASAGASYYSYSSYYVCSDDDAVNVRILITNNFNPTDECVHVRTHTCNLSHFQSITSCTPLQLHVTPQPITSCTPFHTSHLYKMVLPSFFSSSLPFPFLSKCSVAQF